MITSLTLIRHFEGFSESAYQDSAGVWTVGYGFTSEVFGGGVAKGTQVTREGSDRLLETLVAQRELAVRGLAINLQPNQLAALTCLAYNIGIPALERSNLIYYVRSGNIRMAAMIWPQWDHAGGQVVVGMLKRRLVEAAVFLGETFEFVREST